MMNWSTLFTENRLGSRNLKTASETRGQYTRDYDKVIFSSQFRRLQNKTQVFPLPGSIFVHNRLTHSLEVASVGRTMARKVGEGLSQKYGDTWVKKVNDFYRFELSDVIQTACLSHDIGNPPYGHFGEEAIRDFFKRLSVNDDLGLSHDQLTDLCKFEGNANAFRILTTLFQANGLKLTYPTIASVIKYPIDSSRGFDKSLGLLSAKKSGYFVSEKDYFEEVMQTLGVPKLSDGHFARHPFVFLVEAADDICYRIIDLEDALRLKIVSFEEIQGLLLPFFEGNVMEDYIMEQLEQTVDPHQKLALLRAFLINDLSSKCANLFLEHEMEILAGKLNESLLDLLDEKTVKLIKNIDSISFQKIYNSEIVIERELAGYKVIYGLLSEFVGARINQKQAKSKKIECLLPHKFTENMYSDLLAILDHITDMTDEQALELYKKLNGL
jgi:dGTPase